MKHKIFCVFNFIISSNVNRKCCKSQNCLWRRMDPKLNYWFSPLIENWDPKWKASVSSHRVWSVVRKRKFEIECHGIYLEGERTNGWPTSFSWIDERYIVRGGYNVAHHVVDLPCDCVVRSAEDTINQTGVCIAVSSFHQITWRL